ncbi:baseplate wedge subunit [Vibrio phage EniLVp02]
MATVMLKAPPIREVRVTKLSANFAEIEWDRIGSNFRYEIHVKAGVNVDSMGEYRRLGYTEDIRYFMDDNVIQPNTVYQFQVRAVYKGFNPGDFTESEVVLTPLVNNYTFTTQDNFQLSKPFTHNFFTLNDKTYLDVDNDQLYATLVRPGYSFNANMEWYTEASAEFVRNNGFQLNYGKVPVVCHSEDRVIPAVIDDVIYAFERYQGICKVSNDGGQTWHIYDALRGRAGNPVDECIAQQNSTNTFVLGWDYIYQGIPSLDLTFDNDRERWSTVEYTFEKLDVENPFGFDTERFTPLAPIPAAIRNKAESFTMDDYQLVVCAEDKLYEYVIRNPKIDENPSSPDYGSRIFETEIHRITGTDDAVIKKAQFYRDPDIGVDLGTFYFLVPGVWIRDTTPGPTFGKKLGIDDTHPARGVYRMNRTPQLVVNPDFDEDQPETPDNPRYIVTGFTINGFTRVYGNIDEERAKIDKFSSLTRDDKQLLVGVKLSGWDVVDDPNVPEGASSAVRYYKEQLFTTHQQKRLQAVGTRDGTNFEPVAQDYYGSAEFNWMDRSGTRDFKDWQNNIIYVRPRTTFTVPFDDLSTNRWTYSFADGVHKIDAPDLTIRDFSGYTDGALIHNQFGRMIGYFKFGYRIAAPADIQWIPARHVLTATLDGYTPTVIPPTPEDPDYVLDPDIVPLAGRMAPESYLVEDGLFKKFTEYYLQFISRGSGTAYNNLYNLLNSQYARDPHYTEYMYKEIYSRNRVLDKDKREAITRFFLARQNDFYSTKGIINSYKFLFKLLYNEDVDIEVESLNRFEYYITVSSDDLTDDIVGRRIFTATASADVTYYERVYVDGVIRWKLTLNNLIGQFRVGQMVQSQWDPNFDAMVTDGIKGDTTNYNSDDYKNRSRSYYVMKIRSEIQASQYKNDVVRYVHPVGFGFVGITLLTVLINRGLTMEHVESIVDFFGSIRFDMGSGRVYPERIPVLDPNGDLQYDENGDIITKSHPQGGQLIPLDETAYNAEWDNAELWGLTPYERRGELAPTFDASWARFSDLISRSAERLKDNIGNYYDPDTPSQKKIGE